MRHNMRLAASTATLLVVAIFASSDVVAVPLVMTIDRDASSLTLNGKLSGFDFLEQAAGSMTTNYTGSITVDVDDFFSPTTISILSANADAEVNGVWLPKLGGSTGSSDANPTPPADGDYGIKAQLFGQDAAFAAARDLVFDITSGPENVAGGMFTSSETLTVVTGFFDSWVTPQVGGGGGHDDVSGDIYLRDPASPTQSSYSVLGNTATLTIPVRGLLVDDGDFTSFTGTLVATAQVPEPSTLILVMGAIVGALSLRRRK